MISNLLALIILISAFLISGCGKKVETPAAEEVSIPRIDSDTMSYLEKQQVICDSSIVCPTSLTKIAVYDGAKFGFCTGTLVSEDIVVTSASCLPTYFRNANQDCKDSIFFLFPKTYNQVATRVGCKKILQASTINGTEPALWRNDIAFIQMDTQMSQKRVINISKEGLPAGRLFTLWGIEQADDYTGFIRRDTCEAVTKSYVNPFATSDFSPNVPMARCPFKTGFSGAALVDNRGNLRATVSQPLLASVKSSLEATGLLVKPLWDFVHSTNYACATTVLDSDVLDNGECSRDISKYLLDSLRSQMFQYELLFGDQLSKLQAQVSNIHPYVRYEVKTVGTGDNFSADIVPKCFKKMADWLWTFPRNKNTYFYDIELPQRSYKKAIDAYGRTFGLEATKSDKRYYFQFSLKALRNYGEAIIFMNDDSTDPARQFNAVDCPL